MRFISSMYNRNNSWTGILGQPWLASYSALQARLVSMIFIFDLWTLWKSPHTYSGRCVGEGLARKTIICQTFAPCKSWNLYSGCKTSGTLAIGLHVNCYAGKVISNVNLVAKSKINGIDALSHMMPYYYYYYYYYYYFASHTNRGAQKPIDYGNDIYSIRWN